MDPDQEQSDPGQDILSKRSHCMSVWAMNEGYFRLDYNVTCTK